LDGGRLLRRTRSQSRDHRKWIASLPCLITLSRRNVEAAHVRYADRAYGKRMTGIGEKADDRFCVPLSREFHAEQHKGSERAFWAAHGIDPIAVALSLWGCSGDDDAGEAVIRAARERADGKR
jgi:hypothetical protein